MDKDVDKLDIWADAWRHSLHERELTPPQRCWEGVERHLLTAQVSKYKKRALWLQQMAAAAVVMLLMLSGYTFYLLNPANNAAFSPQLASQSEENTETINSPTVAQTQTTEYTNFESATLQKVTSSGVINNTSIHTPHSPAGIVITEDEEGYRLSNIAFLEGVNAEEQTQNLVNNIEEYYFNIVELPADVLAVNLADNTTRNEKPSTTKVKKNRKVWLGLSMAGNFFNPNYTNAPNSALNYLNQPIAQKGGGQAVYAANVDSWNNNRSSLPALNLQLDAVFQLGKRFNLATSLGYGTFKSQSYMGLFTGDDGRRYPLHYANFNYSKLETVSSNSRAAQPVEAVTQFNFFQVPLKLNYVLINRRFGLAPTIGLNTQWFINAKLQPGDEWGVEEYVIDERDENQFRNLYFSGIAGMEFFYNTGQGTVITLEPTYQHALSPFNKNKHLFSSEPSNLGIAIGIRKRIK